MDKEVWTLNPSAAEVEVAAKALDVQGLPWLPIKFEPILECMIFFLPMSKNEKENHNSREDYVLHFRILFLMRYSIFECFLRIKTICLRQIFCIFI